MATLPFLHDNPRGAMLEVTVQPRASRCEVAGIHQERLRLRLTSPPVEGEANKECVKLLSKVLGIPKSDIEIVQGLKSRSKTILLRGRSAKDLEGILIALAIPSSPSTP